MFKPGDKAVYPMHGVVRIVDLESRLVDGKSRRYYVAAVSVLKGEASLLVPVGGESQVGLRSVASAPEALEALEAVSGPGGPRPRGTWNRRRRGYVDKLRGGGLLEVAEVFRDLQRLRIERGKLSFEERKTLNVARSLMVSEISIALQKSKADTESALDKAVEGRA